tara:strand:+ start:668 stop:2014 length:1347 start_codon:yes stop_codon:yes gene_type:complete
MKTYLFIYDVEATHNELIMKVQPLYCAEDKNDFLPINDKDYTPTKGDKLYFLPGVNIPRVKLKDLSLEHGIKTVRDIDQATHVFCGKNTKDKLVNSHWYYDLDTQLLRDIVDNSEGIMDDYYRENLRQALEFYTESEVVVEYSSASTLRNSGLQVLDKIDGVVLRSSNIYYTVDEENKDLFPGILTLDLFNESKLLKYINGADAATLDDTMFLQISDMFKSSDQDNHIIAMEILANCNYIDSLLYIEMLFERYAGQMSNCRTKNHVNFKSLISFLGKDKSYMGTSIDNVVESLIAKDVFDLEKVKVIMKHYGQEIADSGGTKYFEVKSVTLNEEAAKLLNTNYVHETFPDFIPEGVIEIDVPEIHGNLDDLGALIYTSPGADGVESNLEISDEDIETAITRIERKELKSELIALEALNPVSESELNKTLDESNNNQIEEKNGDDFEWF